MRNLYERVSAGLTLCEGTNSGLVWEEVKIVYARFTLESNPRAPILLWSKFAVAGFPSITPRFVDLDVHCQASVMTTI